MPLQGCRAVGMGNARNVRRARRRVPDVSSPLLLHCPLVGVVDVFFGAGAEPFVWSAVYSLERSALLATDAASIVIPGVRGAERGNMRWGLFGVTIAQYGQGAQCPWSAFLVRRRNV